MSTKGNAKSKSNSAPVRTMAYFAFLPQFFFFPPIVLSADNFPQFEINSRKVREEKGRNTQKTNMLEEEESFDC